MAQITDMNEQIDVRHVLPAVRVPALVLHRAQEYMREASRYLGARLPGARVVELPGADHLPWEGAQDDVLDAIERFLSDLEGHGETDVILTTVLEIDGPAELAQGTISRFRGMPLDAPPGRVRASFDGPARAVRCASALAALQPELRAGVHTGECERHGGRVSGPALQIAAGVVAVARRGEILTTSTVHDLVAGSGLEFSERGAFALPLAGASREWRLYSLCG